MYIINTDITDLFPLSQTFFLSTVPQAAYRPDSQLPTSCILLFGMLEWVSFFFNLSILSRWRLEHTVIVCLLDPLVLTRFCLSKGEKGGGCSGPKEHKQCNKTGRVGWLTSAFSADNLNYDLMCFKEFKICCLLVMLTLTSSMCLKKSNYSIQSVLLNISRKLIHH